GLQFHIAFYACQLAGIVAVPAFPPRRHKSVPRLEAIAQDARAALVLTTSAMCQERERLLPRNAFLMSLPWLPVEDTAMSNGFADLPSPRPTDLALLQYTSGSTSSVKGVMLSHVNVLENTRAALETFGLNSAMEGVSWLPVQHDMGLMSGVLIPV